VKLNQKYSIIATSYWQTAGYFMEAKKASEALGGNLQQKEKNFVI
jgi:hypothetical protein